MGGGGAGDVTVLASGCAPRWRGQHARQLPGRRQGCAAAVLAPRACLCLLLAGTQPGALCLLGDRQGGACPAWRRPRYANENVNKLLVGNKSDLTSKRQVDYATAKVRAAAMR